jgi:Rieske Fe-S protein
MTPATSAITRRALLAASGTAALAAATSCTPNPTPTAVDNSTPATLNPSKENTSAAVASGAGDASPPLAAPPSSSAVGSTSPVEPAPGAAALASVADVQSTGSVVVNGSAGPVLLAFTAGTIVGHRAICTHQGCAIAANGSCPCHGSVFDVATGAVQKGPARQGLDAVAVTITGGQIYAG